MSEKEKDDLMRGEDVEESSQPPSQPLFGFGGKMDESLSDPEMMRLVLDAKGKTTVPAHTSLPTISREQGGEGSSFPLGVDPRIKNQKEEGLWSQTENMMPICFTKDPEMQKLVHEFLMNVQNTEGELQEESTNIDLAYYGIRLALDFGRKHHGFKIGQIVGHINRDETCVLKALEGEEAVVTYKREGDKVVPLNEIYDVNLAIIFGGWASLRVKISSAKKQVMAEFIGGTPEDESVGVRFWEGDDSEDSEDELSPEEQEDYDRRMQVVKEALLAEFGYKGPDDASQPVGWHENERAKERGMREIIYQPEKGGDSHQYVSISFQKMENRKDIGVRGTRGWVRRNIQVEDRYPNDGEAFSDKELFRVLEEEGVNLPPEIKALMVSVRHSVAASVDRLSVIMRERLKDRAA